MSSPISRRSIVARLPTSVLDVDHLRLEELPAAEGQELARQAGRALRRPADLLHVVGKGVALLEHAPDQVAVAHDHREEVVEVVGDPAGQPSDRLHLLRLPELGLEPLPLGGILEDRECPDRRAGRVPEEGEREAALHPAAVTRARISASCSRIRSSARRRRIRARAASRPPRWSSETGRPSTSSER